MALEYVVTKRVFGFDDTKTEKYVAKSVRSGQMSFSKTCAKVSVTRAIPIDTDYTDGSSSGGNGSGGNQGGDGGIEDDPLG